MNQQKTPKRIYVVFSIISALFFYLVLYLLSRWFPSWTGRTLNNEWIIVIIAAIPIFLVLVFMVVENISKAKIAGIEIEFDKVITTNLLESSEFHPDLTDNSITKGRRSDLSRSIRGLKAKSKRPRIILVPLDRQGMAINFVILRQYIYAFAEFTPLEYIVFLDQNNHYVGFTTVEKFKERFPRLTIEYLLEDLANEGIRSLIHLRMPGIENAITSNAIPSCMDTMTMIGESQWNVQRNDPSVQVKDLERLGASTLSIQAKSKIKEVYKKIIESDYPGIPVVDNELNFIGIATQEKIAQAVISRLLDNNPNKG